jgi:hypothetical protein
MQPVTPRFLSALRNSHRVLVQVDAMIDGVVVATNLPIVSGSVSVDRTSGVRRQLSVQIADAAILPTLGAQLTPYGVELVVRRGIDYGDGTSELVPLGVFRLDVGTNAQAAPTTYTGPDRAKAMIDAAFLGPRASDPLDAVAQIEVLAHEVLPDIDVSNVNVTNPEDGTAVLPVIPQVFWDRDRWAAMSDLAASLGAELYFSAAGDLLVARTPTIGDDSVWTIDQGAHGVLVDFSRELSREDTFNGVVASGERSDGIYPARAVAIDDDPDSPTLWGGPFGQVTYFYASALIHTPNGAQQVADALLADKRALSRSVSLRCVPNPALDVGDVVAVRMPGGVDEQHLVDRITIPLDAGTPMSIETRTPDAVITIVDPPPPLPPIDVPPVTPMPPLPPYDIPKPPKVPTLPDLTHIGLPGPPYVPGLPNGPYGPGTDPYVPGGVPVVPPTGTTDPAEGVESGEAFTLGGASSQLPTIHHKAGACSDGRATATINVSVGEWGDAGPARTTGHYNVVGDLGAAFAIAVRVRGDDDGATGLWHVVHSGVADTEAKRSGDFVWDEPPPGRFVDMIGVYRREHVAGQTVHWEPPDGPRNGPRGHAVYRSSTDALVDGSRVDLTFRVYALSLAGGGAYTTRFDHGWIDGGGTRHPVGSGNVGSPSQPGLPSQVSVAYDLDLDGAVVNGFYADVVDASNDAGIAHWTSSLIAPGSYYAATEPDGVKSGHLTFTGHNVLTVEGVTDQGGSAYIHFDAYGGVRNNPPSDIVTRYAYGIHDAPHYAYSMVSPGWRLRGGEYEFGGGYWSANGVNQYFTDEHPPPLDLGGNIAEPNSDSGVFLDALGVEPGLSLNAADVIQRPRAYSSFDGGIDPPATNGEVFTLRDKPIRTIPQVVVRLNNKVQKADTYDLDYGTGTFTVLPAMGGEPGDVVTVVYYHDAAAPIVDPLPDNPQPVITPP